MFLKRLPYSNGNAVEEKQWRHLLELQVALQLFNCGNGNCVFVFKFVFMCMSVFSLSAVLIFSFDFMVAVIMLYTGVVIPIAYFLIFYRAPMVADRLEKVKRGMLRGRRSTRDGALLKRRLAAVSAKGVWVGGFRTFERESMLIFCDFIIKQVCSIVLSRR